MTNQKPKRPAANPTSINTFKSTTIFLLVIALFFNLIYQPLPDNFDQPWKYRIICFGADLSAYFGHFLEKLDIIHRLNFTRFAYHSAVGLFNIRDPNDNIEITEEYIDHVMIRRYKPINQTVRKSHHEDLMPTILFFHGGGYFLGSADELEPVTYLMSRNTNSQVVYVEYRLIPEHKFPAALTDCYHVSKHLIKNHKKYLIDLNKLALMGDSAGGNLATVIGQKLIEENIAIPRIQVLIYPILQFFDFTLPSYRINLPKRVLGNIDHENFKNFIHYFTGYEVDDTIFMNGHTSSEHKNEFSKYVHIDYLPIHLRNHSLEKIKLVNSTIQMSSKLSEILLSKEVSPLLVDDDYLHKHTPVHTYLLTTEMDILRDDGFIYADRLRKLGKNIEHKHYNDLFHGILGLLHGPLEFRLSHVLLKECADYVNSILHHD